ncbi:MAG: thiamine pyrophosphate-dependent enzyme [Myxococcota bacterium]|nr:thiamine pyrophosphate-dependent enzyme [Myxococcota bacterium]
MTALEQAEQTLIELNPSPFYIPLGAWKPIVQGAFAALPKRSWVYCGHRARLGGVLRGCRVERLLEPQNGAKPFKIAPTSLHPAHRALHAVGTAIHTKQPTLCFLGSAALANGSLYEAFNIASLHKAPIIFVLIHHPLTGDAPVSQQSSARPKQLAQAFGLSSVSIEGTAKATQAAVQAAVQSLQTTFIEITLEK